MGKKTGVRTRAMPLALGLVLGLALGLGSGPAGAGAKAGKASKDDAAAARRLPSKVTFHKSPSDESRADRARRLQRECQGRPNAGACLGFTGR
jgi:hypothetical protein